MCNIPGIHTGVRELSLYRKQDQKMSCTDHDADYKRRRKELAKARYTPYPGI